MHAILITFLLAFVCSLLMTPFIGKLGIKLGAVDHPGSRKVHQYATARTGGASILLAFSFSLALCAFFWNAPSHLLPLDQRTLLFFLGALLIFGTGFIDDLFNLKPRSKLLFQILSASVAFYGGVRIDYFQLFGIALEFEKLSYPITVFWFILFINAVNLVDGLDGLAAGIVFFTALLMVVLSTMNRNYLPATLFAALGGAVLGFLRYNFNPATIFLGDGGSYFLGYMVAGISIFGALKSQVSAAMFIPLLALGIPVFDTLLSPLRRFARGQKIFQADRDHIHHRLLKLGFSAEKAVALIYLLTLLLCLSAVLIVNIRDQRAGFLIVLLGVGAFFFIRQLGYFDYFGQGTFFQRLKSLTAGIGFNRQPKNFFGTQMVLLRTETPEDLWHSLVRSLEMLAVDGASLYLAPEAEDPRTPVELLRQRAGRTGARHLSSSLQTGLRIGSRAPNFSWQRPELESDPAADSRRMVRIEMDLVGSGSYSHGRLVILRALGQPPAGQLTFQRLEILRQNLVNTLDKLKETGADMLPPARRSVSG
jgi:UDP-GlcNAc:undecaprenyl-phosphate GlcNAc-1-phosphate transferase